MAQKTNTNAQNNTSFEIVYGYVAVPELVGYEKAQKIPANAAVFTRPATVYVKGADGKSTKVACEEFLAVKGVKSTKPVDIVLPMLGLQLAALREAEGFKSEYAIVNVGTAKIETKVRANNPYARFMQTDTLWKSDNEGKLTKGVTLGVGQKFSQTAMKSTKSQPIFDAKGDALKQLLYNAAKAVIAQGEFIQRINTTAQTIVEAAYAK